MAYFASGVYSTPLDILSLEFVLGTDCDHDIKLAHKFQALGEAVKSLSQWYTENHTGSYVDAQHLLPTPYLVPQPAQAGHWIPARTFEKFILKFTDACFTTHGRAVFKGEVALINPNADASPVPVYIKFVRKYGVAAHEHLAKARFALELRWYGKVYGGPMMVIMDEVEGLTIDEILAQRDEIPEGEEAPKVEDLVTKKDLDSLHEAVAAMRAGGFLHGDLRPPNVVLQEQPDGSRKAYIIDFDWAGADGEARYPRNVVLNPHIRWPRDALTMPGTLITAADDDWMVSHILKLHAPKMMPGTSAVRASSSTTARLARRRFLIPQFRGVKRSSRESGLDNAQSHLSSDQGTRKRLAVSATI